MAIQLIIWIIMAASVGVFVAYKTSDVWRTKIKRAGSAYAKWTAENIVKMPKEYLAFCEDEAKRMMDALKASEVSVAQNRAKI